MIKTVLPSISQSISQSVSQSVGESLISPAHLSVNHLHGKPFNQPHNQVVVIQLVCSVCESVGKSVRPLVNSSSINQSCHPGSPWLNLSSAGQSRTLNESAVSIIRNSINLFAYLSVRHSVSHCVVQLVNRSVDRSVGKPLCPLISHSGIISVSLSVNRSVGKPLG